MVSVTPFAPRALDRGLAALLTSIIRLAGPRFNKNSTAGELTAETPYLSNAITTITRRAEEIDLEATAYIDTDLDKLSSYWLQKAAELPGLGYEQEKNGTTLALLKKPERGQWELFTCLNSLRNVEPNVHLILDDRGMNYVECDPAEAAEEELEQ